MRDAAPSSIQARLTLLAAAAIVPLVLLFAGIGYLEYRADRARSGQRQLDLARSVAVTVERELEAATDSLKVLVLSPRLQEDDLPGFRKLAVRFMVAQPQGAALILLARDGRHLVNTLVPEGGALPRRAPAVNAVLTERVFDTGQPMISNVFPRALGGSLIVTADVPVLRDGRVVYDMSLVLPVSRFADILGAQHLPDGAVCSIFDRVGAIVARIPNGARYAGRLAGPSLLPTLLAREDGVLQAVTLEGMAVQSAFSHARPSDWSVSIAEPEAMLRAPLRRALRRTLAAGVMGLLFSAAVAAGMAQRILQPIRALTRLAARPAEEPVSSLGIRELDEVAAALRQSEADRQAALVALQALNDDLEARIAEETASRVQAQERLAQAQRMEALGQLAGGIAHDFNNVLQAVTGGLSLIHRRADDAASVRRLSAMASDAAARGASITGRLLTFARRGDLAAVPVAPGALLESLREILAHTLGPDMEIRLEVAPDVPELLADRAQLETALINLAVNARDAMPQGGLLLLSAAAESVADDAHPAGLAPGDYVRLALADAGTGMSPLVLSRASEPFFTTKEPGQGTGLGLAMARGFAEQSGGGFAIASTQGAGTRISLWFPRAGGRPVVAAVPDRADPPGLPAMRLLMVDDESMVREVLAGEMEARGFLVTTAADGAAALALLDGGAVADLLITDFAMPGMGGVNLINEARRRRPGLPALLLTGYLEAGAEAALAALGDRLTVVLRKPIGGDELARRAAGLRRRG